MWNEENRNYFENYFIYLQLITNVCDLQECLLVEYIQKLSAIETHAEEFKNLTYEMEKLSLLNYKKIKQTIFDIINRFII